MRTPGLAMITDSVSRIYLQTLLLRNYIDWRGTGSLPQLTFKQITTSIQKWFGLSKKQ